jgi:hypothetical protein
MPDVGRPVRESAGEQAGRASARLGYRTLIAGSVQASKDAAIMGHHDHVTQCSRLALVDLENAEPARRQLCPPAAAGVPVIQEPVAEP